MTTPTDLILAAAQRIERSSVPFASTTATSEWLSMTNYEAQALYGELVSKGQTYFATTAPFTITGGVGQNSIDLYSTFPDYQRNILIEKQVANAGSPYFQTVNQINSSQERNILSPIPVDPRWGLVFVEYEQLGRQLNFYPPQSSGGSYQITYIPKLPTLTLTTPIDGYYLNINGWDQYIVFGVAAHALIKERDIEGANMLFQLQNNVKDRIFREALRDDGSPGFIADLKATRGGYGGGGGGWRY